MSTIKETKELVYKKGLAVVRVSVEEVAGEYRSSWNTTLRLYFKSKNAINNASKILGYKLDKKSTTEAFEKGRNGFEVSLDGNTAWMLNSIFGYKEHIGRNGYIFNYINDYTSKRVSARINPNDIYKGMDERTLDINLGSCADSYGTFKDYLDSVIYNINAGTVYYCPGIC